MRGERRSVARATTRFPPQLQGRGQASAAIPFSHPVLCGSRPPRQASPLENADQPLLDVCYTFLNPDVHSKTLEFLGNVITLNTFHFK